MRKTVKKRSERFEPAFFWRLWVNNLPVVAFRCRKVFFFGTGGRSLELIVFSDFVFRMLCAFYHGVSFHYQIAIWIIFWGPRQFAKLRVWIFFGWNQCLFKVTPAIMSMWADQFQRWTTKVVTHLLARVATKTIAFLVRELLLTFTCKCYWVG